MERSDVDGEAVRIGVSPRQERINYEAPTLIALPDGVRERDVALFKI
jgi:hypothetical protein